MRLMRFQSVSPCRMKMTWVDIGKHAWIGYGAAIVAKCDGGQRKASGTCLKPERDWAVIDERHLHIRAEFARLYDWMLCPCGCDEIVKKAPSLIGRRSRREARTQTTVRIGGQRELRDEQQTTRSTRAVDVLQGQVHLARRVAKHTIAEQPGEQLVGDGIGVAALRADKREQTCLNRPRHAIVDTHFGAPHPLNQRDQATCSLSATNGAATMRIKPVKPSTSRAQSGACQPARRTRRLRSSNPYQ